MKAKETIRENGCVIAEKNWDAKSRILYVDDRSVLMQGKENSYAVQVHKDLLPFMNHCEESDTGFVKFRADGGWLVGFQKLKSRFISLKISEEHPDENWKDERGDWDLCSYFSKVKTLDEFYSDYEVGV